MRKVRAVPALALCLVAAIGAGRPAARQEKPAKPEKPQQAAEDNTPLPSPVQATVEKKLPGCKITGFEHEHEAGRFLFFVDVTTTDNKSLTVLCSGRGQYLGQVLDNDEDAGDVFLDLDTAPDAIKAAIDKYFGKEQIDNLFMEVEDARFIFVAEQTKEKVSKWVNFGVKGELISVETEVALKDLPVPVKDALKTARPSAKLTSATTTDEKEKKKTFYTVEVEDAAGKFEISVTPEGKIESTDPVEEDATRPAAAH